MGESASGKSTIALTVQQLQQLQQADSGEIFFKGQAISSMSKDEKRRLQRDIQYIFQDPLHPLAKQNSRFFDCRTA